MATTSTPCPASPAPPTPYRPDHYASGSWGGGVRERPMYVRPIPRCGTEPPPRQKLPNRWESEQQFQYTHTPCYPRLGSTASSWGTPGFECCVPCFPSAEAGAVGHYPEAVFVRVPCGGGVFEPWPVPRQRASPHPCTSSARRRASQPPPTKAAWTQSDPLPSPDVTRGPEPQPTPGPPAAAVPGPTPAIAPEATAMRPAPTTRDFYQQIDFDVPPMTPCPNPCPPCPHPCIYPCPVSVPCPPCPTSPQKPEECIHPFIIFAPKTFNSYAKCEKPNWPEAQKGATGAPGRGVGESSIGCRASRLYQTSRRERCSSLPPRQPCGREVVSSFCAAYTPRLSSRDPGACRTLRDSTGPLHRSQSFSQTGRCATPTPARPCSPSRAMLCCSVPCTPAPCVQPTPKVYSY
eukprot:RCo045320